HVAERIGIAGGNRTVVGAVEDRRAVDLRPGGAAIARHFQQATVKAASWAVFHFLVVPELQAQRQLVGRQRHRRRDQPLVGDAADVHRQRGVAAGGGTGGR